MSLTYTSDHRSIVSFFFFFNDRATPEFYTLSLQVAFPFCVFRRAGPAAIRLCHPQHRVPPPRNPGPRRRSGDDREPRSARSEEHTSELQSHLNLVCRLLLEKKKIYICSTDFSVVSCCIV